MNKRISMAPQMNKEKQLKENMLHKMFFGLPMLSPILANQVDHILIVARVCRPSNEITVSLNEYIKVLHVKQYPR